MPRVPTLPHQISEVYIDESSQTKHRYLGLGGIILEHLDLPAFDAAFANARLPELPNDELKWTKVSTTKLAAYQRVVDLFFDGLPGRVPIEFHSIVVDTTRLKDRIYNFGSREIGFNKEVYQLCQKFRRNADDRYLHVYLDERRTRSDPEDLRLILNRGAAKAGDCRQFPFRRLQMKDSKLHSALQVSDVLLGGLLFTINGHRHAKDASPAKCSLADHILKRAHISYPMVSTNRVGRFTVWHRDLR